MRISVWSSDVCSSDLAMRTHLRTQCERIADAMLTSHQSPVILQIHHRHAQIPEPQPTQGARAASCATQAASRQTPATTTSTPRSEERREGEEGVSTCRCRWSQYH